MKTMKKLLSLLLTITLLFSALPVIATAETDSITVYVTASRYDELIQTIEDEIAVMLPVTLEGKETPAVTPSQTPVPTETPKPTPTVTKTPTPTPSEVPQSKNLCSLSIRCDKALSFLQNTHAEKLEFLPPDGVILSLSEIEFTEGETVFDVLKRELQSHKIPFEFNENPMFQSAYIEGICNLYEFDCGDQSGWLYRVNGKVPSVGCSQYPLKAGDKIEFLYTASYGDLP